MVLALPDVWVAVVCLIRGGEMPRKFAPSAHFVATIAPFFYMARTRHTHNRETWLG